MINLSHVSFGYIKQPMLLLDINLMVNKGNLFVFGQEGAGKTSLLELLCGMQTLYAGKIEVCGKLPQEVTNNITYLPADVVALKSKTVLQNMQYACDAISKDYSCINLTDEFIKQFGATKFKKLSPFNKAVFAIKRAEIKNAKVVLIDVNLAGFTNQEIVQYAQIINGILQDNNKVVIVAVSAQDYKKLELQTNNSQIAYLYATKLHKFNDLQHFKNDIAFMGMAEYLALNNFNGTISINQSGSFLNIENRTIKINEKHVQKIANYFDETTTSAKIKIFTNLDLANITDKQINDFINNRQILLFDWLTTEILN